MSEQVELQLMRLLHGELSEPEALEWRRRIGAEPDLARRWAEVESLWSGIELPSTASADPGLRLEVKARLLRSRNPDSAWELSSPWSRLAAAAALTAGIGLGMTAAGGSAVAADEALFNQVEPSLAESYWLAMTAEEADPEVLP